MSKLKQNTTPKIQLARMSRRGITTSDAKENLKAHFISARKKIEGIRAKRDREVL
jgi:hypothetical protein